MFGPCWVNFYGSPREFSDFPDEYDDLNLGKARFQHIQTYLLFHVTYDVKLECHILYMTDDI